MTRFERWFVCRVFAREVLQGVDHAKKITGLYELIREACEKEFTEDNNPTMDAFLYEQFEKTQRGRDWKTMLMTYGMK